MACAHIQKDDPCDCNPVVMIQIVLGCRLNINRFASVPGRGHHDMRMRTM
jgi:hypothetical protein